MKSISLARNLRYQSHVEGVPTTFQQDFQSVAIPDILLADFHERMTEYSVRPEDMLRNRIYPVGSGMGYLLDFLGFDWKGKAQKAGPDFTFAGLFSAALQLDEGRYSELVEKARREHNCDQILAETHKLVEEYLSGFRRDLAAFESQNGWRIQIDVTAKSVQRSRSSRAKKWLVDSGTRALCSRYQVYTLKNAEMNLQIQNAGVLETTDWDKKHYNVASFIPEIATILVDGQPLRSGDAGTHEFTRIEIAGTDCVFSCSRGGTVTTDRHQLNITIR
jgi:hypothetical protein